MFRGDLEQQRDLLIDKYHSALTLQMQQLSPHFPSLEEARLLKEVTSALCFEVPEEWIVPRGNLQDLDLAFEIVSIDGEVPKQVAWNFQDNLTRTDGEFLITQDGRLIEVQEIDQRTSESFKRAGINRKPGFYFKIANREGIISPRCKGAILPNNERIEGLTQFWEDGIELAKEFAKELDLAPASNA